ncbi:fatty acid desaturase 4, chloroplastic-like [Nicotiana tabacum]|uniref:Fatty acid desaturase 4, chloroplastic-like n=1 Tax=Nicotiana tabacum TaxID=4097 RepID=A0A1S3ZPM8_TOBAC|nr:PREDICTED: fatty acid desaturase 4, chloroplastic-like [Nicotiana tabacum]
MSSILPQNHAITSSQRVLSGTCDKIGTIQRRSSQQFRSNISRQFPLFARVYCVSSSSTTKTPPLTEPLLLQPQPANYEPPTPIIKSETSTTVTSSTRSVLNDPSLQSTWAHRAWMASGCTTVLISLAKSATGAIDSHTWVAPIVAGCIGYVLSDFASGIYHWGIDNYGSAKTPVFGSQIDAFQGHHKWPWTITRREFANNLHALARAVTFTVLPIDLLCNDSVVLGFVGVFSGCIMFSQQFHSWAHGTKSKLPPLVVALQDAGILVSRSQHAAHHRPPYNNNYCIVSGAWNEYLDRSKVFELLEMIFFFKFGVRPRSWSEPNSEWTEETETQSLPASN